MSDSFRDATIYKVEPRRGSLWDSGDECLLGISVGQSAHEGAKFVATVQWASKQFTKIHVWLADTLHRHNLRHNDPPDSQRAKDESRKEGDLWLERNERILSCAEVPVTISRWDDWLLDPRYTSARDRMHDLYRAHPALRKVVETDSRKYLSRSGNSSDSTGRTNIPFDNCVDLILEECSVFCLLLEDHPGVDIYPGSELETTRFFRTQAEFEVPAPLANRRFSRILFRKKRSS